MANNYPSPQTPYIDGLIHNDNPYTAYPQVAKPEIIYNPPLPMMEYKPPAYQPAYAANQGELRRPFWKRSVTWVAIVAIVIISILAGLLGAMATGSIKTAANSSSRDGAVVPNQSATTTSTLNSTPILPATSASTPAGSSTADAQRPVTTSSLVTITTSTKPSTSVTAPPSVQTLAKDGGPLTRECPGVQGLDITVESQKRSRLTFRRECDVNYPYGDTKPGFGRINDRRISSLTECINACAEVVGCVGVVFNGDPECWLKHTIDGPGKLDGGNEAAVIVQS